jgi:hypothetical protein
MNLSNNIAVNDLVISLQNCKISYDMIKEYISQDIKEGEKQPTNISYRFYNLGDIRQKMKDKYQVERFMNELPTIILKKKWYHVLYCINWCDDGIDNGKVKYIDSPFWTFVDYGIVFALGVFVGSIFIKNKSS